MAVSLQDLDLLNVEDLYTEEERLVRDSVREYVRGRIAPLAAEHWEAGTFPVEIIREMGELGLYGASLKGYGLPGVSETANGLAMQELEWGDSGVRSFASVQGSLVMFPIHAFGSEAQKERWLPLLHTGEKIGCFGLTEANHGSDPGGMETRCRKDGDDWILHGSKMWITNGTRADVAVVFARAEDGRVLGFLVERATPGFTTAPIKHKWSMRMSDTAELYFDECRVPEENRLPEATSLRAPLTCLDQARYGIACGVVGAAQACFQEALGYARERVQFRAPIASFQMVQERFAEYATQITQAQLLAWRLGKLKDEGRLSGLQISVGKRNNVRMALECARSMRDLMGAAGIVHNYCIGRHMCNLETVYTYEGTHNIHTLVVGAHVTGIRAFAGPDPEAGAPGNRTSRNTDG